jgi:hypothetical protein
MNDHASAGLPVVASRATFQAELDALRIRPRTPKATVKGKVALVQLSDSARSGLK